MQSEFSDVVYKIYFRACICHLCIDGTNAANAVLRFLFPFIGFGVHCNNLDTAKRHQALLTVKRRGSLR